MRNAVVVLLVSLAVLATGCSDEATPGIEVTVVWDGGGDEPDTYDGFTVSVVPMMQQPSGNGDRVQWVVDRTMEPVPATTDASGIAQVEVSPSFPYRVYAAKPVPHTNGDCGWSGATSMVNGGGRVVVDVAEACA